MNAKTIRDLLNVSTTQLSAPESEIVRRFADGESLGSIAQQAGQRPGAVVRIFRDAVQKMRADNHILDDETLDEHPDEALVWQHWPGGKSS